MANLSGIVAHTLISPALDTSVFSANVINVSEAAPYSCGGWLLPDTESGDLAHTNPEIGGNELAGNVYEALGEVLYDKIIVSPTTIALDRILGTETEDVEVWSTYRTERTCTDLSGDVEGVSIGAGPTDEPFTIDPYGSLLYTIVVSKDGPAVIDVEYQWTITGDGVSTVTMNGLRLVYPTFAHNWIEGFEFTSSFVTSLFLAGTSAESRTGTRKRPKRSTTASFRAQDEETSRGMVGALNRIATKEYPAIIYCDMVEVDSVVVASKRINIDTEYKRFFVGGYVVVLSGDTLQKAAIPFTITDVQSDHVIVQESFSSDTIQAGDKIFPGYLAKYTVESGVTMNHWTNADMEYSATEKPGAPRLPARYSSVPSTIEQYGGKMIFDFDHNWKSGYQISSKMYGDEHTLGANSIFMPKGDRPALTYDIELSLNSRAEIWRLGGFFELALGRLKSFWYKPEYAPFTLISVGTSTVTVDAWSDSSVLAEAISQYVYLTTSAGTSFYPIASATYDSVNDRMTFTVIGSILESFVDVTRSGFGSLVRFSSDELTESWVTRSHATVSVSLIETLEEATISI